MLEIRRATEGEYDDAASFAGLPDGAAGSELIICRDAGELVGAYAYRFSEDKATGRAYRIIAARAGEHLADTIEKCVVTLLIEKAVREGVSFIECEPDAAGVFIRGSFRLSEGGLTLDVARDGSRVHKLANSCHGCGH